MVPLQYLVVISLQAVLAIVLTRTLGLALGSGVLLVFLLACSAVGYLLLTQLTTETVTWRNRAVGVLMPWPILVGGGTGEMFTVKNTMAAIVFAAIILVCDHVNLIRHFGPVTNPTTDPSQPGLVAYIISYATVLCWGILLVGWAWLLRSQFRQLDSFRQIINRRSLRTPLIGVPVAVTISIVLRYQGMPLLSLLVVAIPLLVVLLPVGLLCLVMVGHWVTGKPMRWN